MRHLFVLFGEYLAHELGLSLSGPEVGQLLVEAIDLAHPFVTVNAFLLMSLVDFISRFVLFLPQLICP